MKGTLLLLAALIAPGMAAANGAAAAAASAAANATVAFYSGFPNAGGTLLVKTNIQAAAQGQAQQAIQKADAAVITVSGQAYTFALNSQAKAKGQAELDVKGALKAAGYGKASLEAVVDELAQAQAGQQSLVVLSRSQGSGKVVVALYHPDGGNAGLRVNNADTATIWINGKPHGYQVASDTSGGLMSSLQLKASGGAKTLTTTVADLQTQATLNAGGSSSTSPGGSSNSGSANGSASAGLNVSVGGSN